MIVTKTLEVIELAQGRPIVLLGNNVTVMNKVCLKLSKSEIEPFTQLMKRNKHTKFINTWVEYIRFLSDITIEELNLDHYYKYEDRGWTLEEYDDCYRVDVFIDNYDIEQPFVVRIDKKSITDADLKNLKRICD